jgi:hypothetical protein
MIYSPEVIELLIRIMQSVKNEGDDRWRKISRAVTVILPGDFVSLKFKETQYEEKKPKRYRNQHSTAVVPNLFCVAEHLTPKKSIAEHTNVPYFFNLRK